MDEKVIGNKLYQRCWMCGKLVQTNKALLGGLHLCLTEEEREAKRQLYYQQHSQSVMNLYAQQANLLRVVSAGPDAGLH